MKDIGGLLWPLNISHKLEHDRFTVNRAPNLPDESLKQGRNIVGCLDSKLVFKLTRLFMNCVVSASLSSRVICFNWWKILEVFFDLWISLINWNMIDLQLIELRTYLMSPLSIGRNIVGCLDSKLVFKLTRLFMNCVVSASLSSRVICFNWWKILEVFFDLWISLINWNMIDLQLIELRTYLMSPLSKDEIS